MIVKELANHIEKYYNSNTNICSTNVLMNVEASCTYTVFGTGLQRSFYCGFISLFRLVELRRIYSEALGIVL